MTIGERIRERRIELGLSVSDMAALLGKHRATVYRYESNDIENMPVDVLMPIAKALRTTPAQLMGWDVDDQKGDASQNDLISTISLRMIKDPAFLDAVSLLHHMDSSELSSFMLLFGRRS